MLYFKFLAVVGGSQKDQRIGRNPAKQASSRVGSGVPCAQSLRVLSFHVIKVLLSSHEPDIKETVLRWSERKGSLTERYIYVVVVDDIVVVAMLYISTGLGHPASFRLVATLVRLLQSLIVPSIQLVTPRSLIGLDLTKNGNPTFNFMARQKAD